MGFEVELKSSNGTSPWLKVTPSHVRSRWAKDENLLSPSGPKGVCVARGVVHFPSDGFIVKFGTDVVLDEALNLLEVAKETDIPVPQMLGCILDHGERFIYESFVAGVELRHRWSTLSQKEQTEVGRQMARHIGSLRAIKPPSEGYIGNLLGRPSTDLYTLQAEDSHFPSNQSRGYTGPWHSIASFHDWLIACGPVASDWVSPEWPAYFRSTFPDDATSKFTHGDLNFKNIIVNETGPPVITIIDWERAGFRPSYWEGSTARWAVAVPREWETEHVPQFLPEEQIEAMGTWFNVVGAG